MWPFDARLDLMISDMQSEGYDPVDLGAVIATAKVYPTANYSLPILLALKRIEDKLDRDMNEAISDAVATAEESGPR